MAELWDEHCHPRPPASVLSPRLSATANLEVPCERGSAVPEPWAPTGRGHARAQPSVARPAPAWAGRARLCTGQVGGPRGPQSPRRRRLQPGTRGVGQDPILKTQHVVSTEAHREQTRLPKGRRFQNLGPCRYISGANSLGSPSAWLLGRPTCF